MIYSRIAGTGSYLPPATITNKDLEKMVDTTDEWIVKRVGISSRHTVKGTDDTVATMAEKSARAAMDMAAVTADDIDMIIVGNATPDYYFPSIACFVQDALGMSGIPAFDIGAACAGFIYGISIADQYIKTGAAKRILVIGVEALTKVIDYTDRGTCVLFGDGGGACVLEASDKPGILSTHIHADGQYKDLLFGETNLKAGENAPHINMEGNEVFKIAVKTLDSIVEETLADNALTKTDIDWLIPHQANMRIILATAKRLNLPMERVILTIAEHGNTSAASIPLALDHAVRSSKVKRDQVLLLEGFGAGFTWGSALVRF